jgi:arginase family enzyme
MASTPTFAIRPTFPGVDRHDRDAAFVFAGIPLDVGTTNRAGARSGPQGSAWQAGCWWMARILKAGSSRLACRLPVPATSPWPWATSRQAWPRSSSRRGASAIFWRSAASAGLRCGRGTTSLSFDVDALDPAFAPGTGTPEIGGLASWQAQAILRRLGGLAWAGMDVVEVAPAYDVAEITALAAATIVWEYLALVAARG